MSGRRRVGSRAAVALTVCFTVGCAAVQPALTSLAVSVGQDLLAAASVNHAPRYANDVERLLTVLATEATGLPFEPTLAAAGYREPAPAYLADGREGGGYDGYQEDSYYQEDPYYSGDPDSADDGYYGNDADASAQPYDPGQGYQPEVGAPGIPGGTYSVRDPVADPAAVDAALVLQQALLVQRAGSERLEELADGETLFDGRGEPARGDKLKFFFQANRPCYVYVLGIDATGYVSRIFPEGSTGNPVAGGTPYTVPGGDEWWGLDDRRGVEQVYFVASLERRGDIEDVADALMGRPGAVPADYRPVTRPALLRTRGLVKVAAPPVTVATAAGDARFRPVGMATPPDGTEVLVTRWFRHQ